VFEYVNRRTVSGDWSSRNNQAIKQPKRYAIKINVFKFEGPETSVNPLTGRLLGGEQEVAMREWCAMAISLNDESKPSSGGCRSRFLRSEPTLMSSSR